MEYVSLELMNILIQNGYNHSSENTSNTASWYQVINWIFRFDDPADEYERQFINNNLEFWYETLLEHKFSLMYEFIGRLEEWFESNNLLITITSRSQESWQWHIQKPHDKLGDLYDEDFYTKQQAKHEAILKCFELIKGE